MRTFGDQLYKRFARPILFRLPPELTHTATAWLLQRSPIQKTVEIFSSSCDVRDPRLHVNIAGLEFPSPVGLAAGFDKQCEFVPAMMDLGFGYVVGGTVMLAPRQGNPSPRLLRLPAEQSLINSMGFPSKGVSVIRHNLQSIHHGPKPLVISVSGLTVQEFVTCHASVEPFADAVELNISSPNTAGLCLFQEPGAFTGLLGQINAHRRKPIFVKLPPYSDTRGQDQVLSLVQIARRSGVEGVTATNAPPVAAPKLATGKGGLSGKAIFQDTLRAVRDVRAEAGGRMAIHGTGGIFNAEDAFLVLQAGADTVQLLTGLIYQGPGIAGDVNRGLLQLMEQAGIYSIPQLTRSKAPVFSAVHTNSPTIEGSHSAPQAVR